MRAFPGSDPTKIKAMVETGNVEWDMAQLSRGSIMNLQKTRRLLREDRLRHRRSTVSIPPTASSTALEMLVWAQVLAYRTDAFKGAAPKGWADFWDTKKFPGDRAMFGTGAGGWPEMEFALMAAGVPPDKLYPLDIDKALGELRQDQEGRRQVVGHRRRADPAADRPRGRHDHASGTAAWRRCRRRACRRRSAGARAC